jgi:CDP-paratose 2-epimerase
MSSVAIVTGAAGLIGSEACRFFVGKRYQIVGVDNDPRAYFLGQQASTKANLLQPLDELNDFTHYQSDIRDREAVDSIFNRHRSDIAMVIHTAAHWSWKPKGSRENILDKIAGFAEQNLEWLVNSR